MSDALNDDPVALFTAFGIDGPPVLRDVIVERLQVAFSFETKEFNLKAAGALPLSGGATARLSICVGMAQRSTPPGYTQTYTGTLTLRLPQGPGTDRELAFTIGRAEHAEFVATWSDSAGVTLADLAMLLGVEDEVLADLGALGTVNAATIAYSSVRKSFVLAAGGKEDAGSLVVVSARRPGSRERDWAVRVSLGLNASLSGVPLLKGKIPAGLDAGARGLSVLIGSKELTAERTAVLNRALAAADASLALLPAEGVPAGVGFSVDVLLPGQQAATTVAVRAARRPRRLTGPHTADSGGGAPLVAWVSVERQVGPLQLSRIGVAYAGGVVWVLFEASLGMAGLLLAVDGLGVGVPPSDPTDVRFRLDGLAAGYSRPPLVIAGALVNRPDEDYEVLIKGALVVALQRYGLIALGAYAKSTDLPEPSMFVFGKLSGKFGAPPFAVSAIMAGFGYNTTVRVPEGDQVLDFPFLKDADDFPPDSDPLAVLKELMSPGKGSWVRPAAGQMWFAAGLGFELFEFLQCQALVVLEVGGDFALAVLGTAEASFPRKNAVPGVKPYARVRLGLSARYRAGEGVVKVSAQLGTGSYLVHEDCVLTGGFAFYLWTTGDNAGDFVLTLGGYHPKYAPAWNYPQVPRLGLVWPVTTGLTIEGGVYLALTPGAVMAGGALAVNYRSGSLHAWLTAHADLLIEWAPFRFDADVGISIGIRYVLNLWLVRTTIRVEVGATLRLWGPPTAGTVTVHLSFVRFTIAFGQGRPQADQAADWAEVLRQLPDRANAVRLLALEGLVPSAGPGGAKPWVVGPDAFSFAARTAVPLTQLKLGKPDGTHTAFQGSTVNVRPRRGKGKNLSCELVLTLLDDEDAVQDLSGWVSEDAGRLPLTETYLPAALWSPYEGKLTADSDQWVGNQLVGIDLRRPLPQQGGSPGEIKAGTLSHDDLEPDGALPFAPSVSSGGAPAEENAPGITAPDLTGDAVVWARDRLFTAMEYLEVSPRTNDRLHPHDPLVAGDPTVPHRTVGPKQPTVTGPRLYAVSGSRITPIDPYSLTVHAASDTGEERPFLVASKDGTRACTAGRMDKHSKDYRLQIFDIAGNPPKAVRALLEGDKRFYLTQKPLLAAALFADGMRAGVVFEESDQLFIIHLKQCTLSSVGLAGFAPGGMAASPRSSHVYVSLPFKTVRGNVRVFDANNVHSDQRYLDAGPGPTVLAADPAGRWLYAINDGCSTVTAVPLKKQLASLRAVRTGTEPRALAATPDGKRLCVANSVPGTVSVFEVTDKDVSETADPVWVGPRPTVLAVSPDSTRLFVAREGAKELAVLDIAEPQPVLLPVTVRLTGAPVAFALAAPPPSPLIDEQIPALTSGSLG
ncbi:DUF6603 domain-containing protein [Streptomyces sp. URMC 129]|uniref:DUF6603 domain-containing protein n=1 Tax=Streptomyces sp. URMC 129 TaxID=3423407 RepID=UPI003F1C906D